MRTTTLALVALLASPACYRDAAAPPAPIGAPAPAPHAPNPAARFAVADGATLRILDLLPEGKIVVEREVRAPAAIAVLVWNGPDPAVWLEQDIPWHSGPFTDGAESEHTDHVNEMGLATATGYHAFAALAWPKVPKPTDEIGDMMSEASWNTMIGAPHGEIWQGHCSWFGGPDGGWCGAYTYARRVPSDGPFGDKMPAVDDNRYPLPDIPRATSVEVAVGKHLEPGEVDDGTLGDEHQTLQCKPLHGPRVEWPDHDAGDDDTDHTPSTIQTKTVYWIASEPPIFQIDTSYNAAVGQAPDPAYVVFEGCVPSKRYAVAFGGPHELSVVVGSQLAVMWRGREVAHAAIHGSIAAFAPVK